MKKFWICKVIMAASFFTSCSLHAFSIADAKNPSTAHTLYPVATPNKEGYLAVSDKHTLFYATYGNPDGTPVIVLHGGPGAGCTDDFSRFFDLTNWHVIMFDQRGAMRSLPFACMEENTPQHSIADIEMLRKHLGIEQWVVFGGSWGSTLGLLYGQAHPEQCLGFILRGIFLGRQQDALHLLYGMGKIFPEAYEPFLQYIAKEEQTDILSAYYQRVMDSDPQVHLPAARIFLKYDSICSTHLPNEQEVESDLSNDTLNLSVARAFLYYTYNHFFLESDQILSAMQKISSLPSIIIQGRWDAICLPYMAYALHQNWHNSTLWMVPDGGHSPNETSMAEAVAHATDLFIKKIKQKKPAHLKTCEMN